MSTQSKSKLLDLTPEVVENIIRQISHKQDLASTRLVCKTLDQHAAKELFNEVSISKCEKDIDIWNKISEDDIIRYMPRHVIIHTLHTEHWEDFKRALNALPQFPSVDSVEIRFTAECVGKTGYPFDNADIAEQPEQREEMLKTIFQAIKNRASNENNKTIRKLTIVNLQNCPVPDLTTSDLFHEVMSQLEELHISTIQEDNPDGPDHDYSLIEMRTFPTHLVSDWLAPVSATLKALSIYHDNNWGPLPGYFDASSLSFSKLETLALGYYTLAHDNDINWILRIKSLRKLILHQCMIASWIAIIEEDKSLWNPPMHDWTRMPNIKDAEYAELYSYSGTWAQNLDRIAGSLSNLVDFRFDMGWSRFSEEDVKKKGAHEYDLEQRQLAGTRIFPERYIAIDVSPFVWAVQFDDGRMDEWMGEGRGPPENRHITQREGDQRSLGRLMEALRARK